MQLDILTSSSELNPIQDFKYIFDLARCSKCSVFILLKSTNKLYGAGNSCETIHEIDVPFLVNTDLYFTMPTDKEDKAIIDRYESFFIPDKFNYTILPSIYWEAYKAGDLIEKFEDEICEPRFILYDKSTMQPIEQFPTIPLIRTDSYYLFTTIMNQVEGLFRRFSTVDRNPIVYPNIHLNETIRSSYDGKTNIGRVLCNLLTPDGRKIGFYFYKSLVPLAKADTMDLEIRFDRMFKSDFLATFKPKKKKNPLTFNTYGVSYSEKVHCMFRNYI